MTSYWLFNPIAMLLCSSFISTDLYAQKYEQTVPVEKGAAIEISNLTSGFTQIIGASSDSLKVHAALLEGDLISGEQAYPKRTRVDLKKNKEGYHIVATYERPFFSLGNWGKVDLIVEAPFGTRLIIHGTSHELSISNWHGEATISHKSGDVKLTTVRGVFQINMLGRAVELNDLVGSLTIQSENQIIELHEVALKYFLLSNDGKLKVISENVK